MCPIISAKVSRIYFRNYCLFVLCVDLSILTPTLCMVSVPAAFMYIVADSAVQQPDRSQGNHTGSGQLRRQRLRPPARQRQGAAVRAGNARNCFRIVGSTLYKRGVLQCSTAKQPVASAHDRHFLGRSCEKNIDHVLGLRLEMRRHTLALTHLFLLFLQNGIHTILLVKPLGNDGIGVINENPSY
jgi:hypothetical protein